MAHVPHTSLHRYVGDRFLLRITVEGLEPAQVLMASWHCAGVIAKTLGAGISVDDEGGVAVLVVDVTADDTDELGRGHHTWQATAGFDPAPVVAAGGLTLTGRILAPPGAED